MGIVGRLNLDKIGACASGICAVHCLLTGVALGVLSIMGLSWFGSVTTDVVFLTVTLSIASLAIFTGIRRHRSLIPAGLFILGVAAIVISHFVLPHDRSAKSEGVVTTILSVGGGCCLVAFHFVNLRMRQACEHGQHQAGAVSD
jgi:hypothetical protein